MQWLYHTACVLRVKKFLWIFIDGDNYQGNAYIGDLIVWDEDGVCVVPWALIEDVILVSESKLAYEEKRLKTITAYKQAKKDKQPLLELALGCVAEYI